MSRRWVIAILGIGLAAQCVMLLNDGVFWDGWLIFHAFSNGHTELVANGARDQGLPQVFWFHWLVWQLPAPAFMYKLLALVSMVLAPVFAAATLKRAGLFNAAQAGAIGMIAAVYPAFAVGFEIVMFHYVVCYALFFVALWLLVKNELDHGPRYWPLRVFSLAIFVVSFTIESLLVGYLAAALFLLSRSATQPFRLVPTGIATLRRYPDYAVLPLVYWFSLRLLVPRSGVGSSYNQFGGTPRDFASRVFRHVVHSTFSQVPVALSRCREFWWAFVLFAALSAVLIWWATRPAEDAGEAKSLGKLIAISAALLAAATLPYALVGKPAEATGWSTRNAMLMPVPIAMAVVALMSRLKLPRAAWLAIGAVGLGVLSTATLVNNLQWLGRWAKDREVMGATLAHRDALAPYSVLWIADDEPLSDEGKYRFYEWACLFATAEGVESQVGLYDDITAAELTEKLSRDRPTRCLTALDITGRHARLRIHYQPPGGSAASAGLRYALSRVTGQAGQWPMSLPSHVSTFEIEPISPPGVWALANQTR